MATGRTRCATLQYFWLWQLIRNSEFLNKIKLILIVVSKSFRTTDYVETFIFKAKITESRQYLDLEQILDSKYFSIKILDLKAANDFKKLSIFFRSIRLIEIY